MSLWDAPWWMAAAWVAAATPAFLQIRNRRPLFLALLAVVCALAGGWRFHQWDSRAEPALAQYIGSSVTLEGAIQVNNRIVSPQDLPTALEEALGIAEQKVVILRGDKRVLLGQAVDILDMAQKAGAESIALATQSPSG